MTTRIESDLRTLEKLRIKPVFVFPGLTTNKRPRHMQRDVEQQEACRDRNLAWSKYESGQEEAATKLFEGRSGLTHWDLWRPVLRIFRNRNVEFLVAPYVAWAQVRHLYPIFHQGFGSFRPALTRYKLIYLQRHQKAYVHAIYGPTDTLLYPGVDKLIISVNLTGTDPTFTSTSKKAILGDLGVTEDQFLDIGILVGFDCVQPFPPTVHEQALKQTVDMVKFYKSGHAAVSLYVDHPAVKSMQYPDTYARTRSMVKYSLILSIEGTVQPLPLALPSPNQQQQQHSGNHHSHHPTAADIPTDLHDIFTNRLPDEIYFYLSRGLLSPQPLVWLASGQIIEHPPLDNGETSEYRQFVKEVITEGQTGPRATALVLISSVAHSFWTNRKVSGAFWFEHSAPSSNKCVLHTSQSTAQLAQRVSGWHVPYSIVEEELRGQNVSGNLLLYLEFLLIRNNDNSPRRSILHFAWERPPRRSRLLAQE